MTTDANSIHHIPSGSLGGTSVSVAFVATFSIAHEACSGRERKGRDEGGSQDRKRMSASIMRGLMVLSLAKWGLHGA